MMKVISYLKSVFIFALMMGFGQGAMAIVTDGTPTAVKHEIATCGYYGCYGANNQAGSQGGNGGGGYRPKLTSVFAWDIKTGESWQGWGQPDYVLGAMVDCAEKAKQVHGDPRYCRSQHKNNRHSMVVAMGYDRQTDTYQAVSNYKTRSSGNPDKILRECQAKGYEGCKIVWVGEKMPSR